MYTCHLNVAIYLCIDCINNKLYKYPTCQLTSSRVVGIPLDTQWVDIDHMQNYKDFTWDADNFPAADVSAFVGDLHANVSY